MYIYTHVYNRHVGEGRGGEGRGGEGGEERGFGKKGGEEKEKEGEPLRLAAAPSFLGKDKEK
jgi:hypothetical protein